MSRPMRILHLTQYFLPWIGYQETYLAREQLRAGHEVRVVASNHRWPGGPYAALRDYDGPAELPVGLAEEHGIPTERLRVARTLRGRMFMEGVRDAVERFAPDVVHAHNALAPSTFQVATMRRRPFRLVVDEHQLPTQSEGGLLHGLARRGVAWLGRRVLLPRADAIVAVAEGTVEWLVNAYRFPRGRIGLIPLGADTDQFRPDAEAGARVRRAQGIPPEQLVVGYTGKISPQKRLDVLVRALARLPGAPLLLAVGPAEEATLSSIRALADEAGVAFQRAKPVPPAELGGWFNAADLCVWPADCTISHLEAAACGKPIVIPDDPGVADRISDGNGVAVPVGDVDALRDAISRLLADGEARRRMGEAGRALVLRRYSWRAIADSWARVYRGEPA